MLTAASVTELPYSVAPTVLTLTLCALLVIIAMIDARHGVIPDWANAALAVTGLVRAGLSIGPPLDHAALAAVTVFLSALLLHKAFIGWRGRSGIGMGDIKFLAAAAIWTGLTALPTLVLIASISALLFLMLRSLAGFAVTRHSSLAFGPHLAAGLAFVGLFGSLN